MMKGGPKQYPNLSAYVDSATKPKPVNAGIVFQTLLATIGSVSILIALFLFAGDIGHDPWGVLLRGVLPPLALAVFCALGVVAAQKLVPLRARPTPLELEAKDVKVLLKKHLQERRLHKAAPEAVTTLLEETARQYQRVRSSLSSKFWQTSDLPPQYAALRDKALIASDRAINETLLLLRPRLAETVKPQHWKDVVEEVAENLGLKAPERGFVFPTDIEPARNLAEGLRNLANEVEQASIRAITDIPNSNGADASLRSCLTELRALNDAESELDETLKYRL